MIENKIIRLPKKGRLIVVTDIHGNIEDFDKYIHIWDKNDPDCHILFLGDLIHEVEYDKDLSVDILEECMEYFDLPNFHILLGNHELCQIMDESIYKVGYNQTISFNRHIRDRVVNIAMKLHMENDNFEVNKEDIMKHYDLKKIQLEGFMRQFDYFCITENGFFFSHAGVSDSALISLINKEIDLFNLNIDTVTADYIFLEEMIWSRPYDDYVETEIDIFLGMVDCKFMCVGHTPYNGCHILGNQLIFDSSFATDNKYYLDIDLSKDYDDIVEVMKCLKEVK